MIDYWKSHEITMINGISTSFMAFFPRNPWFLGPRVDSPVGHFQARQLGGGADDAPHLIHETVGDGGIQGLRNFSAARADVGHRGYLVGD